MIRGIAALQEMLDCIGAKTPDDEPVGDSAVAKILVEHERDLRALLFQACSDIADTAKP